MKNLVYCACLASMLLIAACADGNRNLPFPAPAPDAGWFVSENLAVIAGMAQQPTEPVDNFSARQDLKLNACATWKNQIYSITNNSAISRLRRSIPAKCLTSVQRGPEIDSSAVRDCVGIALHYQLSH